MKYQYHIFYQFMSIGGIRLWFDVGTKRYTAVLRYRKQRVRLWFDVGKERYTATSSAMLDFCYFAAIIFCVLLSISYLCT